MNLCNVSIIGMSGELSKIIFGYIKLRKIFCSWLIVATIVRFSFSIISSVDSVMESTASRTNVTGLVECLIAFVRAMDVFEFLEKSPEKSIESALFAATFSSSDLSRLPDSVLGAKKDAWNWWNFSS